MERTSLGYSTKNIPIAGRNAYRKIMIAQMESVIRRMRWRAIFWEKSTDETQGPNAYGFKSELTPRPLKLLNPFEEDLYNMIRNIQFSPHRNAFQRQLSQDVKNIKNSNEVLISADKTTNLYRMQAA